MSVGSLAELPILKFEPRLRIEDRVGSISGVREESGMDWLDR